MVAGHRSLTGVIDRRATPDPEPYRIAAPADRMQRITLTMSQLADLRAALNLPEGTYIRRSDAKR